MSNVDETVHKVENKTKKMKKSSFFSKQIYCRFSINTNVLHRLIYWIRLGTSFLSPKITLNVFNYQNIINL